MSGVYRGFLTREQIGLRKPRSRSRNIQPKGSLAHWTGSPMRITSHSQCAAKWRSIQRAHMDQRGWVDIAYTVGICDHGYILAGRGAGVRTAANGTNSANYSFYAICWLGGKGESPSLDAVAAWWKAHEMLGGGLAKDHRDYRSTSCPGPEWAQITDAGPVSSVINLPKTTETVKDDDVTVEQLQDTLVKAGFNPGPVDGIWGPKTQGAFVEALKTPDVSWPTNVPAHTHTFSVNANGETGGVK